MKIIYYTISIIAFLNISYLLNNASAQDKENYTGKYEGIFFFEDDGATEMSNINILILINDTAKYLIFSDVLINDFSITNNIIILRESKIYIGKGFIEDDGVFGQVRIENPNSEIEYAEGMIEKVSELSENDLYFINKAIEEEKSFYSFWRKFNDALGNDDVDLICEYVKFPFTDHMGNFYPELYTPLNAKNKSEFKKIYNKIFTSEIKDYFNKNVPIKSPYLFYTGQYIIIPDVSPYFRDFIFEKYGDEWKLIDFPYFP